MDEGRAQENLVISSSIYSLCGFEDPLRELPLSIREIQSYPDAGLSKSESNISTGVGSVVREDASACIFVRCLTHFPVLPFLRSQGNGGSSIYHMKGDRRPADKDHAAGAGPGGGGEGGGMEGV